MEVGVDRPQLPDLTILALDAFGGFEATRQCFFVADVAPNIVFDTSLSYNFDFIEDFARRFGAERVVFGTDLYSHPVGQRISHLLPQIEACSLDDAEKAAILGGTRLATPVPPDRSATPQLRGARDRREVERAHRAGGRRAHRGDGVDDAVGRGGVATARRAGLAGLGAVDGHVEVRVAGDAHAVDRRRAGSKRASRARSRRRCG